MEVAGIAIRGLFRWLRLDAFILDSVEEIQEQSKHLPVKEVIELYLFLSLLIVEKHLEEFKHLNLDTLFIAV